MRKTSVLADKLTTNKSYNTYQKYGLHSSDYHTPQQISEHCSSKQRFDKSHEMGQWDELLKQATFNLPGASRERLHSHVFKQIQSMKTDKKEDMDPNFTGRPNIKMSQKRVPAKIPFPRKKARYSVN